MSDLPNVLVITKEKVLEAAKKCATAKQVLSTLFPEAFEKKLYECGTIFVEKGEHLSAYTECVPLIQLDRFWILAHSAKSMEYHLINMRTGYSIRSRSHTGQWPTYHRISPNGIEIPEEDIERLAVFSLPQEQKPLPKKNPSIWDERMSGGRE